MPRNVFGFYKGFILCQFKNTKDIFCKASQLSILRLWVFCPNGLFRSDATTQKWAQSMCFPLFSDFLTFFLIPYPGKHT